MRLGIEVAFFFLGYFLFLPEEFLTIPINY